MDYEISTPAALAPQPLVSVLLMAYNHAPYLAKALDSVLSQQTSFPFEVVVGEDCSTDNTREIALGYQRTHPQNVRIITSEENVGSSRNHQRILSSARGLFVAYLDGDDYWLPGKMQRQIEFLQRNSDCIAVCTNAAAVDRDNVQIGVFNDVGDLKFDLAAILRRGNFLHASSLVYRATARDALLQNESAIDYENYLRIARDGHLAHLGALLTAYRVGSSSSMLSGANDRVRELYWGAIMDVPRDRVTDNDFAHGVADFLRRVAFRAIRTRRWTLLREWAPRVFAASPYGVVRTSALTVASMLRITVKEFLGLFRRGPDGRRLKVLYRR